MRVNRGTEYEGTPNVIPPGQSIPSRVPKGLTNQAKGTDIDTDNDIGYESFQYYLTTSGQTRNDGGAGITVKELKDFNSVLSQLGYSFPGANGDLNQWAQSIQLPTNYDSSRPIVATLHIIAEGSTFDTTGFRAYYTMNETAGNPRLDSTGNGNTLSEHLSTVNSASGKVSLAAKPKASEASYLEAADSTSLKLGHIDQTLFGWIYLGSSLGAFQVFEKGKYSLTTTSLNDGIHHRIKYDLYYGGAGAFVEISYDVDARAHWYFVMAEFQSTGAASGVMNLYVNNSLVATGSVSGHTLITSTDVLDMGKNSDAFSSDVFLLDECGIVGRLLSSDEKACIYNLGAGSTWPDFCNA